jgi:ribose-phosphate pyrophosphokinase
VAMSQREHVVLSTRAYRYMAEDACRHLDVQPGEVEVRDFPDGERYVRVVSPVVGREVVIFGGTTSDSTTLELYDLAFACVRYGAEALTLVIPYFSYSTMERAVKYGEAVTAKTRARLLSSIPRAGRPTRVLLLDLHSEGIPHYFEGDIRPIHVYSKVVVMGLVRKLGGGDFVLASTDAGRAKWVQSLANDMGVRASFVLKRRLGDTKTEIMATLADVKDKTVVIYDDMVRSGKSLIGAAQAYEAAGAARIAAVVTHGVFAGDSLDELRDSGLFTQLACTDSHPRARELAGDFLLVEPVGSVLAERVLDT